MPTPIWVIDTETGMLFDNRTQVMPLKSPFSGEVPLKQNDDYEQLDMSDPTTSVLVKCVAAFIDDDVADFMKPLISKQHLAMYAINKYKWSLSTLDTTLVDLKMLQACVFFISDNSGKIDGLVRMDMLTRLGRMITNIKRHIIKNGNKDKILSEIYMFDDYVFRPRTLTAMFSPLPMDWNSQHRDAILASIRGYVAHRITDTGKSLVNIMYGQMGMGKSVFSSIILDEYQNAQLLKSRQKSQPPRQRVSKTRAYKQLVSLMKEMEAQRSYYTPRNRAERRDDQKSHIALATKTKARKNEKIRRKS